jgi:hypothetical protein
MARLILALQVFGLAVLLFIAAGNALLGDWGSVALVIAAAIIFLTGDGGEA